MTPIANAYVFEHTVTKLECTARERASAKQVIQPMGPLAASGYVRVRQPPPAGRVAGGAVLLSLGGIVGGVGGAALSVLVGYVARSDGLLIGSLVVTETGALAAIAGGIALMVMPGPYASSGVSFAPMVAPVGSSGVVIGAQGRF